MVSVHKFLGASLCSALTLAFLPFVASAQAQSKPSEDTPVFAEDLTRDTLGHILNLNSKQKPEARMTPGEDSHMVIMGDKTDVLCPKGQFIELAPNLKITGFIPTTIKVIDGNRSQTYGVDHVPLLRIDPPDGGSNRKVVLVQAFDAQGMGRQLMQCIVREHIANPVVTALDYEKGKEQCGFKIKDRKLFTNACLYLGDMYLGSVGDDAGKIDMDERLLPPGNYTCQMAGKNSDNIYVPGASIPFVVKNRYKIECVDAAKKIVIGEHSDEKLKVTITHTPGLSIKKTKVFIAGNLAGEKEGDDFTIALPMSNVPTGKCFIEVIGIAEDGVTYPVESQQIEITNEPWEQRLYHTTEFVKTEEYNAKIDELWQEVRSNLVRADYSKDIYRDSRTITWDKIKDHFIEGKKADFKAAAEKAFIQMTQYQLKTGRLYAKMNMRTRACTLFSRVVREVGVSSPDGETAKTELDALRKQSSPVL